MTSKPQIPKDLGLKVGSKDEVFWTGIKEEAEKEILASKHTIIMDEALVELAKRKIAEEKEKFK